MYVKFFYFRNNSDILFVNMSKERKNTGLPKIGRNCLGTTLFILLPLPPASKTTPILDSFEASMFAFAVDWSLDFLNILLLEFNDKELLLYITDAKINNNIVIIFCILISRLKL